MNSSSGEPSSDDARKMIATAARLTPSSSGPPASGRVCNAARSFATSGCASSESSLLTSRTRCGVAHKEFDGLAHHPIERGRNLGQGMLGVKAVVRALDECQLTE